MKQYEDFVDRLEKEGWESVQEMPCPPPYHHHHPLLPPHAPFAAVTLLPPPLFSSSTTVRFARFCCMSDGTMGGA